MNELQVFQLCKYEVNPVISDSSAIASSPIGVFCNCWKTGKGSVELHWWSWLRYLVPQLLWLNEKKGMSFEEGGSITAEPSTELSGELLVRTEVFEKINCYLSKVCAVLLMFSVILCYKLWKYFHN